MKLPIFTHMRCDCSMLIPASLSFAICNVCLKSTVLSWSSQVQIEKNLRQLQGHHRGDSAQLYSRDDVGGALNLQQQMADVVKGQWRPHTPLSRGGQIPLTEPSFTLEQFRKDKTEFEWQHFQFDIKHQHFEATGLFIQRFGQLIVDLCSSSFTHSSQKNAYRCQLSG